MSVLIYGALTDGAGIPMSGCHIILKSRVNTSEVVMRTEADVVTGNNGEYSFEARTGKYRVYLKQGWRDEYCVGDIAVYDDAKPGTLNDFLTAPDEGDLKPDVVKRFEGMVAQAQQSAESAAESEQQAGQHVADAQKIKEDCQTLEDNVQLNATAVAEDKQHVEHLAAEVEQNAGQMQQGVQSVTDAVKQAQQAADDSASSAEESKNNADNAARSEQSAKSHADNAARSAQNAKSHADNVAGNTLQTAQDVMVTAAARDDAERFAENARQDATATACDRKATAEDVKSAGESAASSEQSARVAAGYARAAEQAKNDIDVLLANTLKTSGNLSEIAAAGEQAQQESRDNLGLKSAATMEPQADIYDCTDGRLAVPGMSGFGKIFTVKDRVYFQSGSMFLSWAKNALPGRYAVSTRPENGVVIEGELFIGVVDVIWTSADTSGEAEKQPKNIIFYGVNGGVHVNWYSPTGKLMEWESLKYTPSSVVATLSGITPGTTYDGYGIGSLVLAGYKGTYSSDSNRQINRGDLYPGSRLMIIEFKCVGITDYPAIQQTSDISVYAGGAFSGTYRALSGSRLGSADSDGIMIGLFIRVY